MKKIIVLLFLMLGYIAQTHSETFESGGICYQTSSDSTCYVVKNTNGYSGDIVLPNTVSHNGKRYYITGIGRYAFEYSNIESISLGNYVTSIGYGAFKYSNIESIDFGNALQTIGSYAFGSCHKLTSIAIPNSVTSIGESAFAGCVGIVSVSLGNSVKSIGSEAFWQTKISQIDIPNSVTSIGAAAFSNTNLTSLFIPRSVTSIYSTSYSSSANIVSDCDLLKSIVVENGNPNYDSRGNCNAIIRKSSNTLISGCSNTVIPNSVKTIECMAFEELDSLKSITIPNSVEKIKSSAFSHCRNMTSVTIGKSVTFIGEYAFSYNTQLTEVNCLAMTPPQMEERSCFWCYNTAILTVPAGSLAAYQTTNWWNEFSNIIPIYAPGDVDGDGRMSIDDLAQLIDILLRGESSAGNADVNGDGSINIEDLSELIDMLLTANTNTSYNNNNNNSKRITTCRIAATPRRGPTDHLRQCSNTIMNH